MSGKRKTNTASLDRIDNTRGYHLSNVHWIHKDLNRMRNTFTIKQFVDWCVLVTEHGSNRSGL